MGNRRKRIALYYGNSTKCNIPLSLMMLLGTNHSNRFLRIYGMTPDTTRRPKLPERAVDTLRIRFMDDSVQMVYPADTLQVPFQ